MATASRIKSTKILDLATACEQDQLLGEPGVSRKAKAPQRHSNSENEVDDRRSG
jgi:hypothetical protein